MMAAAAIAESNHVISAYTRQESTESGWDNPFRPGGDLSREADEIVELIKGGKPITPTSSNAPIVGTTTVTDGTANAAVIQPNNPKSPIHESPANKKSTAASNQQSPSTKNGASSAKNGGANSTSAVNVQRATTGQPSGDVEHVVLKKEKSKCKCCVVQ